MSLSEIVNVSITRETAAVQRASFGVMMFLGLHRNFTERARQYSDLSAVVEDGFQTTSPEYLAAAAYFGQAVAPTQLLIGRQFSTDITTITPTPATAAGQIYSMTVTDSAGDSAVINYTSVGADTASVIVDALFAHADWADIIVSPTDAVSTLTIAPDVALADYTVVLTTDNLTKSHVSSESLVAAITAVKAEGLPMYGVATYSHLEADILAVAGYVAGVTEGKLIYGYSTGNTTDKTSATTGIMAQLAALNYPRAFGIWDSEAGVAATGATAYAEAAWFGKMLPTDPGSATWKFKTLAGINADSLTGSQSTFIRGHNGNTYETLGGIDITREGKVAEGEYIDVIIFVDWLESRLEERIYSQLVNNPKIPYTDAGVALIEQEVLAQLMEGVTVGGLNGDESFNITVPKVSSVNPVDKANRILPSITFSATLAGAIHAVTVQGKVTL